MSRDTRPRRTRCRLPCIVRAGRGRAHARVLDVSSGGLCFVAPVCFRENARVQVEIVVPRGRPVVCRVQPSIEMSVIRFVERIRLSARNCA